jgi:hypothetical protein
MKQPYYRRNQGSVRLTMRPEHIDDNGIQQVLAHIPPEVIGQTRTVENFFYGPEPLLKKLRTRIRRKTGEAVCELGGEALRVVLKLEVTLPALTRMDETCTALAQELGVEYDGFGVILDDDFEKSSGPAFAPFDRHVPPGTAFAFPLSDGRYGHAIFIAEGMFQFVRLVSERPAQLAEVLAAEPLYRQPIPGQIDPLTVVQIGPVAPATLQNLLPVRFRFTHGLLSPEELDEIARSVGLAACTEESWHEMQRRLIASGRSIRASDTVTIAEASLGANGKLTWKKEETVAIAEAEKRYGILPMHLTGMGRVEYIEPALRGEIDVIDLEDRTT